MTTENRGDTIGFVGLGTMGRPMAACVAKAGFPLIIYDVNDTAAAAVAGEMDAHVAATPKAVAEACRIVITMVPGGEDVRAAALGPDGLAEGFADGSVLIDMSSSAPTGTVALAEELAARGIDMIDAPVSGGRAKAVDGTLTLMVGGEDAVIDRCLSVLEAMSANIFRTGAVGSGHATKALNNLLNAMGQLAASEALLIGERFGLDPQNLLDVVNASTGMNHATLHKMSRFVLSGAFDSGFALDLMVKDVDIALGLARETGSPVPYAELCRAVWAEARENLGPGLDQTDIARWVKKRAESEHASEPGGGA